MDTNGRPLVLRISFVALAPRPTTWARQILGPWGQLERRERGFSSIRGSLGISFRTSSQRLEAGDDVEQFFGDRCLTQLIELRREFCQSFLNVLFGELHGSDATGVLTREGFGTCPEQSDKQILTDRFRQQVFPGHCERGC
jgi:hypothetical protein